jgi:dimethylsulfoniopropionate demethylase
MYTPLVDENGGLVNDPIVLRLAEDRFWISIADSGVLLWLKGITFGRQLDVSVFEPDVSPLAIQGKRSDDLMAKVLGEQVRDLRFFWFIKASLAGTDFIIARSGWSGQGGFEIYLEDWSKGLALWDALWDAGQEFDIRAGCPNLIDRIERGLFSYGSDMTLADNPYECGLDRFFENSKEAEYLSRAALEAVRDKGPEKSIAYLFIEGDAVLSPRNTWDVKDANGNQVGIVTSLAYSSNYGTNMAFAMVEAAQSQHGNTLYVDVGEGSLRKATVKNRFWK